ncbi:MAG: hypothetical protein QF440_05400 [Candidatus Thalassarchaeaceae archaeon]|jgi:hypothetical protein|nr:hypothetical protein [Candidatus Thalassarchaeaceae archaeon]
MAAFRRICVSLCLMALFVIIPAPSGAQQDMPEFIGWEMGFVIPDGEEQIPYSLGEEDTIVEFWIKNNNIVGDIEIGLEYADDNWVGGPDSVTIPSGQNKTYSMVAFGMGDQLWTTIATSVNGVTIPFEISGQLTAWSVITIPDSLPISTDSIEGELYVPDIHRWGVVIEDLGYPISAGTEGYLEVSLINNGNAIDSIQNYEIDDNCPLLTINSDGENSLDEILHKQANPGAWLNSDLGGGVSAVISYDASSAHPTRLCEIEITVYSQGVADGSIGDSLNKDSLELNVEESAIGSQSDNDDASTGNDDGPENQAEVENDNFLFFPILSTPLGMVLAAITMRVKRNISSQKDADTEK